MVPLLERPENGRAHVRRKDQRCKANCVPESRFLGKEEVAGQAQPEKLDCARANGVDHASPEEFAMRVGLGDPDQAGDGCE